MVNLLSHNIIEVIANHISRLPANKIDKDEIANNKTNTSINHILKEKAINKANISANNLNNDDIANILITNITKDNTNNISIILQYT